MDDGVQLLVVTSTPNITDKNYRPVILVPGWFSQPNGWIEVTKSISEFTTLVYIETREKNSSLLLRKKTTQMSIERMSYDLQELITTIDVNFEESICIGSSLGGSALLHLLYESKTTPIFTVLMSPNPDFKLPPIIGLLILAMPLFMIKLVKAYVRWHVLTFRIDKKSSPEQAEKYKTTLDAAEPWKARTSARHVTKFNAWQFLPKINSAVILVGATTDKMHKSDRNIRIGKLIKNSKYIDFLTNKALHSREFGDFVLKLAADKEIEELETINDM